MSKCSGIFQATLWNIWIVWKEKRMKSLAQPAKSWDLSSYSEGQQQQSKSSKAEGQPREATEDPASVTF